MNMNMQNVIDNLNNNFLILSEFDKVNCYKYYFPGIYLYIF